MIYPKVFQVKSVWRGRKVNMTWKTLEMRLIHNMVLNVSNWFKLEGSSMLLKCWRAKIQVTWYLRAGMCISQLLAFGKELGENIVFSPPCCEISQWEVFFPLRNRTGNIVGFLGRFVVIFFFCPGRHAQDYYNSKWRRSSFLCRNHYEGNNMQNIWQFPLLSTLKTNKQAMFVCF